MTINTWDKLLISFCKIVSFYVSCAFLQDFSISLRWKEHLTISVWLRQLQSWQLARKTRTNPIYAISEQIVYMP